VIVHLELFDGTLFVTLVLLYMLLVNPYWLWRVFRIVDEEQVFVQVLR